MLLRALIESLDYLWLKEHDTVNSTAILSKRRPLTNQSMIPEFGIMEQQHQRHGIMEAHNYYYQPTKFHKGIFFFFFTSLVQLFPSQDSVYAPWKTYTESCGKKNCTKLAIRNLYNN